MKVKNLNNSSLKTKKLIKDAFVQLLSEKKEIRKITVSELVQRANISRATFYSHFDDIYGVIEEFEEELVDKFFTNAKLLATDDYEKFFDALFSYMEENDNNYRMMAKSNDVLLLANRLSSLACNKLFEIITSDKKIKNKNFVELDIKIFLNGTFVEYVKFCRGHSEVTPKDLKNYSLEWYKRFLESHCA